MELVPVPPHLPSSPLTSTIVVPCRVLTEDELMTLAKLEHMNELVGRIDNLLHSVFEPIQAS